MNKLKFNGNQAWFITPDSKYGLSRLPAKYLTNNDFSFLTKIKVNWFKMNPDDKTKEGGVIIKNGLHTGLSVVKIGKKDFFIKGTVWTSDLIPDNNVKNLWEFYNGSNLKNFDILIKVNCDLDNFKKEYEIGFSYKKEQKEFSVYCNQEWHTKKYEGELLDYSNSWLWVGCGNAFEECDVNFRNFFNGEIHKLMVFQKALDKNEMLEVFCKSDARVEKLNPICIFDFEKRTDYKILDISENGNHLMKYERAWF